MVEPVEYKEIMQKLLEKTKAGRVPWTVGGSDQFQCELGNESGLANRYTFVVWKRDDKYGLRMEESYGSNSLFSMEVEEEIYYSDKGREQVFHLLTDLFELARRKALNIPEKLATVAQLLDKI